MLPIVVPAFPSSPCHRTSVYLRTGEVAVSLPGDGSALLGDGSALIIGGHADSAEGDWIYGSNTFRYVPGS